jgi:hypothetical protein
VEGEFTTIGTTVDDGIRAILGQDVREEMCILGYVRSYTTLEGTPPVFSRRNARNATNMEQVACANVSCLLGWARFMEWKYPVEVVVTNKAAFRGAGAIGAAASL